MSAIMQQPINFSPTLHKSSHFASESIWEITLGPSVPSRMPITKIIRNTSELAPEMFHGDMFMAVNAAFRSRESRSEGHVDISDLQSRYMTLPQLLPQKPQICRRRVSVSRYANCHKQM